MSHRRRALRLRLTRRRPGSLFAGLLHPSLRIRVDGDEAHSSRTASAPPSFFSVSFNEAARDVEEVELLLSQSTPRPGLLVQTQTLELWDRPESLFAKAVGEGAEQSSVGWTRKTRTRLDY